MVWKVTAHEGCVRTVAFSPFVPHWVASGGDDATVRVWDLRYGSDPVVTLTPHTGPVHCVEWSHSNCDVLASGGADRRFVLSSLNLKPHYALCTPQREFDDSVMAVAFSSTRPRWVCAVCVFVWCVIVCAVCDCVLARCVVACDVCLWLYV